MVAVPLGEASGRGFRPAMPLVSFAAAVALSGLLVAGGSYLGGAFRRGPAEAQPGKSKTYVIVRRARDVADIELPEAGAEGAVRVRLLSAEADGGVSLRYTIAAEGPELRPGEGAALVGRRLVGVGRTSLGQIPLENHLVNVDASAWIISDEQGL